MALNKSNVSYGSGNIIQDSIDYTNTLTRWKVYERKNQERSKQHLITAESKWKFIYEDLTSDESKFNFFKILEAWRNRDKLSGQQTVFPKFNKEQFVQFEKLTNMLISMKTGDYQSVSDDEELERSEILSNLERVINENMSLVECGEQQDSLTAPLLISEHPKSDDGYGSDGLITPPANLDVPDDGEFLVDTVLNDYRERTKKVNRSPEEEIREMRNIVYVCRSNITLLESFQRIEAEKDLLLAMCRAENCDTNTTHDADYVANVCIQGLEFTLKKKSKKHVSLYLCIVKCGNKIESTEIVSPMDKTVKFNNPIKFDNVSPDCQVHVSLFGLRLRSRKQNDIVVYTKKVIKKLACNAKSYFHDSLPNCVYNPYSAFTLLGTSNIKKINTSLDQTFKFLSKPSGSNINDTFSGTVNVDIQFPHKMRGYLTIGIDTAAGIVWKTRWCSLMGSTIYFWKNACLEPVELPSGALPLKSCASNIITAPNLVNCRKPTTLLMKMLKPEAYNYENYYLSTDTAAEYFEWQQKLNYVLVSLRAWNEVSEQTWL